MSNTGIIVDGRGDFHSLKTRFTGTCKILKTDGPRGHTTSIVDIVSGSIKQISMLSDCGYQAIVVMVDFEMRNKDYDKFVKFLSNEFARTYNKCKVDVAVPNRMIENWYLADIGY